MGVNDRGMRGVAAGVGLLLVVALLGVGGWALLRAQPAEPTLAQPTVPLPAVGPAEAPLPAVAPLEEGEGDASAPREAAGEPSDDGFGAAEPQAPAQSGRLRVTVPPATPGPRRRRGWSPTLVGLPVGGGDILQLSSGWNDVPPGDWIVQAVPQDAGWGPLQGRVQVRAGEDSTVELAGAEPASIIVALTDLAGVPIQRQTVEITYRWPFPLPEVEWERGFGMVMVGGLAGSGSGSFSPNGHTVSRSWTTDDEGRVRFDGLPDGAVEVEIEWEPDGRFVGTFETGDDAAEIQLDLPPVGLAATVPTVSSRGWTITVAPGGGGKWIERDVIGGTVHWRGLPAGEHVVWFQQDRFGLLERFRVGGGEPARVELPKSMVFWHRGADGRTRQPDPTCAWASAEVQWEGEAGEGSADVLVHWGGSRVPIRWSAPRGRRSKEIALPAGVDLVLSYRRDGCRTVQLPLRLAAGEHHELPAVLLELE